MNGRSRELIATNESAVLAKSFLDAIVVEDREGEGCFPDPPCADESNWFQVFNESDDLLDQPFASKTGLGAGGGDSPRKMLWEHKTVNVKIFNIADLARVYGVVSMSLLANGRPHTEWFWLGVPSCPANISRWIFATTLWVSIASSV